MFRQKKQWDNRTQTLKFTVFLQHYSPMAGIFLSTPKIISAIKAINTKISSARLFASSQSGAKISFITASAPIIGSSMKSA